MLLSSVSRAQPSETSFSVHPRCQVPSVAIMFAGYLIDLDRD